MPKLDQETLAFIASVSTLGFLSELIGVFFGLAITVIVHSSSAATAIILTLAHGGMIDFRMAAAMILGANIGTTVDAFLASIGTKSAARRAALVHILFNVIGSLWAVIVFDPFLHLVDLLTPGAVNGPGITTHLAMLHTIFNTVNTVIFFPFVPQLAKLVTKLVKDDAEAEAGPYRLVYASGSIQDAPEFNVLRAEKEIRDMAGIVESMFERFRGTLGDLRSETVRETVSDLREKEDYADQMREELSRFLVECASQQLNAKTERNVALLLRIVGDLEDMTDDCFSLSLILERSVEKKLHFDKKELEQLAPYVLLVRDFLAFVRENLGKHITKEEVDRAATLEDKIDQFRNKLRKMSRKRLEAGASVKTELLFIDLVRRIEKLGDYSFSISEALGNMT
jgi:phosphate:Na+ symporter